MKKGKTSGKVNVWVRWNKKGSTLAKGGERRGQQTSFRGRGGFQQTELSDLDVYIREKTVIRLKEEYRA